MVKMRMPAGFEAYNVKLARRIADARQAAGMSQKRLAELIGVNNQRISKIERGGLRIDSYFIALIARQLGVDPGWLVDPESDHVAPRAPAQEQAASSGDSRLRLSGGADGGGRCAACGNGAFSSRNDSGTLPRVTQGKQVRETVLFMEVAENLRAQIASGVYKGGQQLPPTRALAAQFGTSTVTVTNGIRLLAEVGIVYTVRTMGVYVEKGGASKAKDTTFTGPVPPTAAQTDPE